MALHFAEQKVNWLTHDVGDPLIGTPGVQGQRRARRAQVARRARRPLRTAVAERFDERYAHQADPAVVEPVVDFLADLAGDGDALELGIGTGRIALPLASAASASRHRPLGGDGREAAGQAGADRIGVTIGDFATTKVDGDVLGRVPRREHDHEPDDAGGAGRVLPERRRAPRAGRLLRRRGAGPRLQRLPPGETFQPFDVSPTHLGFDEYDVATRVSSPTTTGSRTAGRGPVALVPLRVAVGARPHGAARRDDAARALGGLDAPSLHERERRSTSPVWEKP